MNRSGLNTSRSSSTPTQSPAVNECVKYIICREGSKIPIKKSDIKAHLEKNIGETLNPNEIKNILNEAARVLKKVYGYKLIAVDTKDVKYIVVLDKPSNNTILSTYINPQHRKLLIAALIHIYMTGTPVDEEEMWSFLKNAQLIEDNEQYKMDILKKTYTRQMYLKYTKVENKAGEFSWGQRAEEEIPKMFLLNKMATAFNVDAKYWPEQYRNATTDTNVQGNVEID